MNRRLLKAGLLSLAAILPTSTGALGAAEHSDPGQKPNIIVVLADDLGYGDFAVHHSLHGVFAIRQGPWKLISHRGSGGFSQPRDLDPAREGGPPGQLYHLQSDPSETRNVYAEHPDVVQRLSKLLKRIQDERQATP